MVGADELRLFEKRKALTGPGADPGVADSPPGIIELLSTPAFIAVFTLHFSSNWGASLILSLAYH